MIPALGQDDGAASFVECGDDVVQNEPITCCVDGERSVGALDPPVNRGIRVLKHCLSYDEPMIERSASRMASRIHLKPDRSELHLEYGVMAVASQRRGRQA